jgi:hypothetical protein
MKKLLFTALILTGVISSGWSQAEYFNRKVGQIKDANNANQANIAGPPETVSPQAPAKPAAPATTLHMPAGALPSVSPDQMKVIEQLTGDFSALKAGEGMTAEKTANIIKDLQSLSKVGLKPTKEMLTGLATNLGKALAEKVLPAAQIKSLCGCISGIMNSSVLPGAKATALVTRAETILKGQGISAEATSGVTKSLTDIANFMQKGKSELYK